jgi:uncharacterized RDD family membrane protein YckC
MAKMSDSSEPVVLAYAGPGIRLSALLLDFLIWLALTLALTWLLYCPECSAADRATSLAKIQVTGFFEFFLMLVYSVGFKSSHAMATPGMLAFGLRVTDVEGRRISGGRAVGRFLAFIYLTCVPLGLGSVLALVTKKRQTLHDLVAGTLVVAVRR